MSTRIRVFGGVAIRRVVTTVSATTCLAGPQMQPLRTNLHALRTLSALWVFDARNRFNVTAGFRHSREITSIRKSRHVGLCLKSHEPS